MEDKFDKIEQFLEKAKESKKTLREFKMLAVKCQDFELAGELRELEKELFPESEEIKIEKQNSRKLSLMFKTMGLNINPETCWLINAALKKYWKRRENFDLKDAAKLISERDKIFDL